MKRCNKMNKIRPKSHGQWVIDKAVTKNTNLKHNQDQQFSEVLGVSDGSQRKCIPASENSVEQMQMQS